MEETGVKRKLTVILAAKAEIDKAYAALSKNPQRQ